MSNFLSANDSDGLPYIQWGSDAVQWSKKQGDGQVPFTFDKAVIDMTSLKVGWIKIGKGVYDAILVPFGEDVPARPNEMVEKNGKEVPAYNRGFGVSVLFPEGFGDERLFSWSTTQKGSLEAMSKILDDYEAGKGANAGKIPVVQFKGHVNKKFGMGSSNIPQLETVDWVDKPAEFNGESAAPAEAAPTPAQPVQATGASNF